MTYPYNKIKFLVSRMKLEDNIDKADPESLYHASKEGYDYTKNLGSVDLTNSGSHRATHLLINVDDPKKKPNKIPIIHVAMSAEYLENGLWRKLRIFPDAICSLEDQIYKANPDDIYSITIGGAIADKDRLIYSLTGHTIRDAAEFLYSVIKKCPHLGKLLLANRFNEALKFVDEDLKSDRPDISPKLIDENFSVRDLQLICKLKWPQKTIERWKAIDGKNYLPPFIFLIVLAELQRLAQNVTSHISLSFHADGSKIMLSGVIGSLKDANSPSVINEKPLADMIATFPFQTYKYLPNKSKMHAEEALKGPEHTNKVFTTTNHEIPSTNHEKSSFHSNIKENLKRYLDSSCAHILRMSMSEHPDNMKDRKARGNKNVMRTEAFVKYWGLDWHEHALFGLHQIKKYADDFNQKYMENKLPKSAPKNQSNMINSNVAMSKIILEWLETTNPAAHKSICKEIMVNKATKCKNKNEYADLVKESENIGKSKKAKNLSDFARKKVIRDRFKDGIEPYDPYTEEIKIYARLIAKMKGLAARKPVEGMPGYTAQYHPKLWIDSNCENDDIGFYIGCRKKWQSCKTFDITSKPPLVLNEILSDIDLYRHTPSTIEDRAAQNLAMTIGEMSTDPMHSFFRRRGI